MRIDIITLFPSMFKGPFEESIIKRAQQKGIVEIHLHNLRDFTTDRHRTVDDAPFGGGAGMVMKVEPIYRALNHIKKELKKEGKVILLSPQGRKLTQELVAELKEENSLILICGRYEGVDERVREHLIDKEISIGDYVLSGGELPAMVLVDALVRLLPGAVGNERSVREDSFYRGLLDYPQYTRPAEFMGWKVPEVLRSGDHQKIEEWRRIQMLKRTLQRRADLLEKAKLTPEERKYLEEIKKGKIKNL
ncbi:MAG TPA: tRNA (guanosine(37)-N1)-methyltransferase TrmD [Candidatus Aerophobetes bacterium]|uniref:tRNA (guanine-N(1)-)-methyltransferase n=1 Tax=Aerophobetes bacterium TaxID=2030807 RepID=A0A7V0QT75_UNCAE|nr:tRNA (guanosine(37)-N1)-methyltransferase TrmD [Candidatus Aerophobetes bacterium]